MQLSCEQVFIVRLLCSGRSQKEIAHAIGLSNAAMAQRIKRINNRFRARNTVQTCSIAVANRLVERNDWYAVVDNLRKEKWFLSATYKVFWDSLIERNFGMNSIEALTDSEFLGVYFKMIEIRDGLEGATGND